MSERECGKLVVCEPLFAVVFLRVCSGESDCQLRHQHTVLFVVFNVCLQAGLPSTAVVAAHGNFDSEWAAIAALHAHDKHAITFWL